MIPAALLCVWLDRQAETTPTCWPVEDCHQAIKQWIGKAYDWEERSGLAGSHVLASCEPPAAVTEGDSDAQKTAPRSQ